MYSGKTKFRFVIYLSQDLISLIEKEAEEKDISKSAVVREKLKC